MGYPARQHLPRLDVRFLSLFLLDFDTYLFPSLKLTGREVAYDDEQHAMDERAGSTHRISDETSQIDRTSKHTLTDFEKVTRPVAV